MSEPLLMPRNLAIRILHEAQIAQPQAIRGVVAARDGAPVSFHVGHDQPPAGKTLWAQLWSMPTAAAVPLATDLQPGVLSLLVSLNIKGVLEMRAWRLHDGQPLEQVLAISD